MKAEVIFEQFKHTGVYVVAKDGFLTLYENAVAQKYSVIHRIGKPCYSIHGNQTVCSSCPIRTKDHVSFVNRTDLDMIFCVRCCEVDWEGTPAWLVFVTKQIDLPKQTDSEKSLERMTRALKQSVKVYTELNLQTMQYQQIDLRNINSEQNHHEGSYEDAYAYSLANIIDEADLARYEEVLAPERLRSVCSDAEGPQELSVRYHRKGDLKQTYQIRVIFLRNEYPHYVVSVVTDVTDSMLQSERLSSLENTIQNLLLGVLVLEVKDGHYRVLSANQAACDILGLEPDKLKGPVQKSFYASVHEEDLPKIRNTLLKLRNPCIVEPILFRNRRKDGNEMLIRVSGKSVAQPDSVQIYLTYEDVTEASKLQDLQIELDKERAAAQSKLDFLSNMSHEIRTPMNAILGMAKLAEDTMDPTTETAEYIHKIQNSATYLIGVLNDILEMNRISSNKLELKPEWIGKQALLQPIFDMVVPMMKEKNITFRYDPKILAPGRSEAYIDAQKFQQVLMNLLSNACKFTPTNGEVELQFKSLSRNEETMRILDQVVVKDSGCGMSSDFLNRIFQPFEQERTPGTSNIPGTGLGLSISRSIARAMGGDITVKTKKDQGSTFSFTFASEYRISNTTIPQKATIHESSFQSLHGKKVLMAEDNDLNAEIATRLLEREGIIVTRVKDGSMAVHVFASNPEFTYDAILMDIRMPIMDGLTATRALRNIDREDAKRIPIIAMTANAFEEDRQKSEEAGMNAHLAKPIDTTLMYQTLCEQIERTSTQKRAQSRRFGH